MRSVLFYAILVWLFSCINNLNAEIINVPGDQPTIQAGINASVAGDTVLIQPGIYIETISFLGKDIVVGSLFLTTLDTTYISQTIIDGNNENYHLVSFLSGESSAAKIIGFTIKNANTGYLSFRGLFGFGIRIENSSPTIEYNIIENNWCYWYMNGCGIGILNSSAIIKNNIIRNNEGAYNGGGIFIDQSNEVVVENNIIYGNITQSGNGVAYGAGICLQNSNHIVIKGNLIYKNEVDHGNGGGIALRNTNSTVLDNTITGNIIHGGGAGLFLSINSFADIRNNIIWANIPLNSAQLIGTDYTIEYCNIQGGHEGTGNINLDPFFQDTTNNNYYLTLQSPCIDAGDPNTNPDPDGTITDMGFYYYDMSNYGSITGTISLNGGHGVIRNAVISSGNDFVNPNLTGNYRINLLPGTYNIIASLPGYENASVNAVEVIQSQISANVNITLNSNYTNHTIYIKQDGTGDFTTVQEGIDASVGGDTILIFPGTYFENIILNKNLIIASRFLTEYDTAYISQTIIDGLGNDHTFYVDENLNNFTLICGLTLNNSANYFQCIYGYNTSLRIQNCNITNTNCSIGSGVNIRFSKGIIIDETNFVNNERIGVNFYYSTEASITNSTFNNNSIGVTAYYSKVSVMHNSFNNNLWGVSGGGAGTVISRNIFFGNTDAITCSGSLLIENNYILSGSDGIYCSQYAAPVIVNNLIANNTSEGIICFIASPTIVNNTIVNNSIGIRFDDESTGEVIDNIVWGNESSFLIIQGAEIKISYSCIEGGFPPNAIDGGGNIYDYPQFVDTTNLDFHLAQSSPCLNSGIPDTAGLNIPVTDLDGNNRIYGDRIEIGPYEILFTGDEELSISDNCEFMVYPNPFKDKLSVSIPNQSDTFYKFTLYSSSGQIVENICISNSGQVEIELKNLKRGIYFYKIQNSSGEKTKSGKLVKRF